jgi:hypothetical protein
METGETLVLLFVHAQSVYYAKNRLKIGAPQQLFAFKHQFAVGGGDFDVVAGFEIADENFRREGI